MLGHGEDEELIFGSYVFPSQTIRPNTPTSWPETSYRPRQGHKLLRVMDTGDQEEQKTAFSNANVIPVMSP